MFAEFCSFPVPPPLGRSLFPVANVSAGNLVIDYDCIHNGLCDGQKLIANPALVISDSADSGNIAIASRNALQVWNFRTQISQPDGSLSVGRFVFEGIVDGQFGISSLRLCQSTVAAITNSGDFLELWFIPPGSPSRQPVASHQKIKQERMATSLHVDELYPIH